MDNKKKKNPFTGSINVEPLIRELQKIDPYGLMRFIIAHDKYYDQALAEIRNGHKETHWMWYIFPQLKGLGSSDNSIRYGIENFEEAKAYYNVQLLYDHLLEISKALLEIDNDNIIDILGYPDNLKLQSCMTLFELVDDEEPLFKEVLDKYYNGERDQKTLDMINEKDD